MGVPGPRRTAGALVLAISAVVLILAIGNLISLPSTGRQLIEAVPSAGAGVADAVAQSDGEPAAGLPRTGTDRPGGTVLVIRTRLEAGR